MTTKALCRFTNCYKLALFTFIYPEKVRRRKRALRNDWNVKRDAQEFGMSHYGDFHSSSEKLAQAELFARTDSRKVIST